MKTRKTTVTLEISVDVEFDYDPGEREYSRGALDGNSPSYASSVEAHTVRLNGIDITKALNMSEIETIEKQVLKEVECT